MILIQTTVLSRLTDKQLARYGDPKIQLFCQKLHFQMLKAAKLHLSKCIINDFMAVGLIPPPPAPPIPDCTRKPNINRVKRVSEIFGDLWRGTVTFKEFQRVPESFKRFLEISGVIEILWRFLENFGQFLETSKEFQRVLENFGDFWRFSGDIR